MYKDTRKLTILLPGLLLTLGACSGVEELDDQSAELESALSGRAPQWVQLGGNVNPDPTKTMSFAPKVAANPRNNPVVAVTREEGLSESEVLAFRWTGTDWSPVGNPISGESPAIAVDSNRRIYLCVRRSDPRAGLFVKRWNGSRWVGLGGDIAAETGHSIPPGPDIYVWEAGCNMILDSNDAPIVSWRVSNYQGFRSDYIARWNDEHRKWEILPQPPVGIESVTSVDIDEQDRLYAVSADTSSFGQDHSLRNHVWRWNGQAWSQLGGTIVSFERAPGFAAHGTTPYLAIQKWQESEGLSIQVMRWHHGLWRDLRSPGPGASPELQTTQSGKPVLAYQAWPAPNTSRVAYFADDAWHTVGADISNSSSLALCLDPRGRLITAWRQEFPEDEQLGHTDLVARSNRPLP